MYIYNVPVCTLRGLLHCHGNDEETQLVGLPSTCDKQDTVKNNIQLITVHVFR